MRNIIGIAALLSIAISARAISGNPSSNVLYDSANTASNLVARDASGNFAAGTITFQLPIVSTTTIASTAYPTGTPLLVQESELGALVSNAYNLGVSTANVQASCVYVAVSTGAAQGAVAGISCNK